MSSPVKVVLVEQSDLFRASFESYLNEYLDIQVIEIHKNFDDVNFHALSHKADVLVFSLGDDEQENFERLNLINSESGALATIVVSSSVCVELNFVLAKYFGIHAFFLRNESDPKAITDTIRFLQHERPLQMRAEPKLKKRLIVDWYDGSEKVEFTQKEIGVLKGVIKNKTNAQISEELGISSRTVESHRRKMVERTGSKTMVGVIIKAIKWGHLFSS